MLFAYNLTFKAKMKRALFTATTGAGYSGAMYAGYLFSFIWCAIRLLNNTFTYGTFTAVMQYALRNINGEAKRRDKK